jgi:hypothetical protein
MPMNKLHNEYAAAAGGKLFEACPKAVFAAIAVSALTVGGDYLEEAELRLLREWWTLYHNGIVPQKPCFPEPEAAR